MRGRAGISLRVALLALAALSAVAALAPASASAGTSRPYQFSFGTRVTQVAVDQETGDIYAVVSGSNPGRVVRYDSSGAPKDFTAGPGAGTNEITGLGASLCCGLDFSQADIAIDNSGGPLDGTIYIANPNNYSASNPEGSTIYAFARSGAQIGSLDGSTSLEGRFRNPCGVAVDQSDGSLYVASRYGSVRRFAPSSPGPTVEDADFTVTGISGGSNCGIAADAGSVYVNQGGIYRYSAADFTASDPGVAGTLFASGGAVDVDPGTGDVYVNGGGEGKQRVFDPSGQLLYSFGAYAYSEGGRGIAVKAAASGPAEEAYVSGLGQISAFGPVALTQILTHPPLAAFGPDGTSAGSFGSGAPRGAAFDDASRRLYTADPSVPGVYGFDASAPPAFSPLAGFEPLSSAATGTTPGLAVDNTSLGSAGNIYLASSSTNLLYGFDSSGAALGGSFPLDPETSPGAPDGEPAELCGVAVDSSGDVFVSNIATKKVLEYSSAGAYLGAIDTSAQERGAPCQLAFDSNDDLYVSIGFINVSSFYGQAVWKYTAASSYASASEVDRNRAVGLALDPATRHLYVAHEGWVDEWKSNGELFDEFTLPSNARVFGATVDEANHDLYLADYGTNQIRAFGPGVAYPEVATRPATALANASATLNGTAGNQEVALTDCHFEYVTRAAFEASRFTDLSSGGEAACEPGAATIPLDLESHAVSAEATGLAEDTEYRFRLSATNEDGATTVSGAEPFTTASPPSVETVGSPIRTATTARLDARIDPKRAPTSYHFEYVDDATCQADVSAQGAGHCFDHATRAPESSSEDHSAGSGNVVVLGSQEVGGLQPDTAYHYRVIADNGNPDGPATGAGRTLTTRATDAPLSHGEFPGPPGSDRAWELVSASETYGNPITWGIAFSDSGDRALYGITGGLSEGATGNVETPFLADRPAGAHPTSGWQTRYVYPSRGELFGAGWQQPATDEELSTMFAINTDGFFSAAGPHALFRIDPEGGDTFLREGVTYMLASNDASRIAVEISGAPDPAYPSATAPNLYDLSSGEPRLLGILPGGAVPACGVGGSDRLFEQNTEGQSSYPLPGREHRWLSPDGSLLFFPSQGAGPCGGGGAPSQLYMRRIEAQETLRISPAPVSGPECPAAFIKSTPGAAFFWTQSRLVAEDTAISGSCLTSEGSVGNAPGGDVYRYEISSGAVECVTCVVPGRDADVRIDGSVSLDGLVVAADGSRVYFVSPHRLLPGAAQEGIYRVDVQSGDLAYVAPAGAGTRIADLPRDGGTATPDGAVLVFQSSNPALDALTGSDSGGSLQDYIYDDRERSLFCASCPTDGSPAAGAVPDSLTQASISTPNATPLSADGDFAFATPTPLAAADHNSAEAGQDPRVGYDVYEWRDGRQLLVTDGSTSSPVAVGANAPQVQGVDPSGRDVFFAQAAQLTPDALDGIRRLYDARIGGGIVFPPEGLPPCDLNSGGCEGAPSTPPDQPGAGTAQFEGPPNVAENPGQRCGRLLRLTRRLRLGARRLRLRARRLSRLAHRTSNRRLSRIAHRRASRFAKASRQRAAAAKRQTARARRCRRANRRAQS